MIKDYFDKMSSIFCSDHPTLLLCGMLACGCQTILYPSQLGSIGCFINHPLAEPGPNIFVKKVCINTHLESSFYPHSLGRCFIILIFCLVNLANGADIKADRQQHKNIDILMPSKT